VVTTREVALPTYRVTIGAGLLPLAGDMVHRVAPAHRYAIITDDNVGPIYASRLCTALGEERTRIYTIEAGESHKTRATWASLTDDLLAAGFGRDSAIVALGGGVVGDVAGFVAATYMRSIPYVQAPTSLLAMIDASVGGKTGVDTPAGKNLVGAFHQPAAVVADIGVLATLPAEHVRAGMAEAIKHGVIADAAYFERAKRVASRFASRSAARSAAERADLDGEEMLDLVARSVEIKAGIVRRDEREGGVRKTLNFGHTIGHAVERCSEYRMLHGDAVAIGMAYESALAEQLGVAARGTAAGVREALQQAALPSVLPPNVDVDAVIEATHADKKARAGTTEYALPVRIGEMAPANGNWSLPVSDAAVRALFA
jgi:3-dehydroquinate synthase